MRGRTCVDKDIQLNLLEEFKMFCEEYQCFNSVSGLKKEIINLLKIDGNENCNVSLNYIAGKAIKDLVEGKINHPIEAYQKYYEHKIIHPTIYIMCGLSGSGKSSKIKSLISEKKIDTIVSLDELRLNHKINNTNRKKIDGRVRQESKALLKIALAKNENIVFDACNLRKDFRTAIVALCESYHAETILVFIESTMKDCIKNDKTRKTRTVGENVIIDQVKKFHYPEAEEFNSLY
jgi:predicted kinase